ncbi:putative choline dehydrogenase [Astrocystis sublimbata]|nr:putative choline dehydrogenase [Astrocystis sublimbata]
MASREGHPRIPHTTTADFLSHKFDYLIIGGGTAGLVVASRLSENPALTIGVLEAGPAALGIEAIDVPGLYGQVLGNADYDWSFETVPQDGLGGRALPWPRGKVLGGTSALNFMTWNRASRGDYDAWRELGCEGWGWDELLPYFKKSEQFHIPDEENQKTNSIYFDEQALGNSGPVQIHYASEYSSSHAHWHDTMRNLGVATNKAHLSGSNTGAWTNLGSIDPVTGTRSYATTAYYLPHASRPNLHLLTEARVAEIILEEDEDGEYAANGVRFQREGQSFEVCASREIILSAGTVQSPQLLEVSGIGDPEVLAKAGVAVKVRNPNVGESLQEHMMAAMIFEVDPTLATPDDLKTDKPKAELAMQQFHASRTGPLTILPNSIAYLPFSHIMSSHDQRLVAEAISSLPPSSDPRQSIRQRRFLDSFSSSSSTATPASTSAPASAAAPGQIEYIFDLGNWSPYFQPAPSPDKKKEKKYATCLQILQHPFSRGSIHISSSHVEDKPAIDPRYYGGDGGSIDLALMAHAARFAAYKIARTQPLAGIIRRRVFPPSAQSSLDDDDDGDAGGGDEDEDEPFWRDWLIRTTITDWHPVGTCAMGEHPRPRPDSDLDSNSDIGDGDGSGVVDHRLRVHGVEKLRVVDASVMPLQISAHLQATVYAIGEKGAAMILEDALDGLVR